MGYLFYGGIYSLIWLAFWGLLLYAVWVFVRKSLPALNGIGPEDLSPLTLILTLFLIIAALFLFQQVWNDLGRIATELVSKDEVRYVYNSAVELSKLILRAVFVGPVTLIAVILYFSVRGKGKEYGVITLPYFIASLIFLVRLIFGAGQFVLSEYKYYGIYIVLIFIIAVISGVILFVQKQYESYKHIQSRIQKGVEEQDKKPTTRQNNLPPV